MIVARGVLVALLVLAAWAPAAQAAFPGTNGDLVMIGRVAPRIGGSAENGIWTNDGAGSAPTLILPHAGGNIADQGTQPGRPTANTSSSRFWMQPPKTTRASA